MQKNDKKSIKPLVFNNFLKFFNSIDFVFVCFLIVLILFLFVFVFFKINFYFNTKKR